MPDTKRDVIIGEEVQRLLSLIDKAAKSRAHLAVIMRKGSVKGDVLSDAISQDRAQKREISHLTKQISALLPRTGRKQVEAYADSTTRSEYWIITSNHAYHAGVDYNPSWYQAAEYHRKSLRARHSMLESVNASDALLYPSLQKNSVPADPPPVVEAA